MRKPSFFQVTWAVGRVTFSEIVRDKVLYNAFFIALLLLSLGSLAARLSVIRPERVVLDLGLMALSLSCSLIAIFVGAPLLARELDRRTALVALSKPISRGQFLAGKYAGLAAVLFVNWVLLSVTFGIVLKVQGALSSFDAAITVMWALLAVLLQSFIAAAVTFFFSSFSTTSLAVIMSLGVFLVGNNISQLRYLATQASSPAAKLLLRGFATVVPNFEILNLEFKVTYGLPVPTEWIIQAVFYSVVMVVALMGIGALLLQRREV